MKTDSEYITYEQFGAVGDGVADDLPAICDAHTYANTHGLPVKTTPDATYHLGRRALTVTIETDTDWNTSRFTIDDTEVEDHKKALFYVPPPVLQETLHIAQLNRDQKRLDLQPEQDVYVYVENERKKRYIRRGLNQSNGTDQRDCFILRRDGSIQGDIDWNYDQITQMKCHPVSLQPLILKGGVFTTVANRMKNDVGYNYWNRNIAINRSHVVIDGLTHYVVGETAVGCPYSGFLRIGQCGAVTLSNCFFTGHKIYTTIGSAKKPVKMGSYDVSAHSVAGFTMKQCRMNHIHDKTRWGVINTNFCKDILLEDCRLSRMDTHMGVAGTYTIRGCCLGHMGLNAIGRGLLSIEESILYGRSLINFRSDYGSTWEGDVEIRNCRWVPACGEVSLPIMINAHNDGMHDFGYPCFMPATITVDGLDVDDRNHREDYQGFFLFSNYDAFNGNPNDMPPDERPAPYTLCDCVKLNNLTTASGIEPQVSPNNELCRHVKIL